MTQESSGVIHAIVAASTPPQVTQPLNLIQTADKTGNLTTMLAALQQDLRSGVV